MKKNSIVIAMVLVLALTVSTFAASFADVPANHWAYEAVNKLVAAGLISGYPDGTFQGQNSLTRYEVATMLARLLDDIAESRAEIMDQVDFMINDAVLAAESGLSEAEAEDVQAILQAVIDKNTGGGEQDALSAGQAEEVANMIASLAVEFDSELMDLGIRVGTLEKKVAALEEATPEKPAVTFNGEYKVEFKDYAGTGQVFEGKDGKLGYYESPFDYDLGEEPDYELGRALNHQLDLNVNLTTGPVVADLNLNATKDGLGHGDSDNEFTLDTLEGVITGNDFTATIKKEQQVGMRPYLFGGFGDWDGEKVDGVVVETAKGRYFLDGKPNEADDDTGYAFAGSNELDILGGFNVVYGFQKNYDENDVLLDNENNTKLVGAYKTFEIGNLAVTPEFALSEGNYFALNAEGNLGRVDANFKYENISEDFVGITEMLNTVDTGDTSFVSVDGEITEENALNFLGFNLFADAAYRSFIDVDEATSKVFNATAKRGFGNLDLTGKLEFQNTTQEFDDLDSAGKDNDVNLYEEKEDKFDKKVELSYPIGDSLTAGAVYGLNKDNDMSEHDYTIDFARGIVTAGVKLDVEADAQDPETHLYAGLNADKANAYNILTLDLTPYAEYKTWTEIDATNILAGVEAAKSLSEYVNLTGGYEWFDVENMDDIDEIDKDEYDTGLLKTAFVGLSYDITEDVAANVDYKRFDFEADKKEGFTADLISAGVSVAF